MKKLTTSLLTLIFSFLFISSSMAQIKAGAGLMYGSEVEQVGLRLDGTYQINEQFSGAADLGFYLPDKTDLGGGNEITVTWWELNANVHYNFYADEESGLSAYGVGGLNFMNFKTESSGPNVNNTSNSDSEVGLNIGAGAEYIMDFGDLFGELKYVVGDADQLNIAVGVRIPVGG